MTNTTRSLPGLLAFSMLAACGPSGLTAAQLCQKNAEVDQSARLGTCTGIPSGDLFGDQATCSAAAGACSGADRALLLDVLTCAEKLPACEESAKQAWVGARTGCVMRLSGISAACNQAFAGVLPDPSGLFDAGVPDAGPQPLRDGGSAVELVAVADETTVALAWQTLQSPANVTRWAVIAIGDGGARAEPLFIDMVSQRNLLLPDAGPGGAARWFLVGETATGTVAFGQPDAGGGMRVDAGQSCRLPIDCPADRVCDLGQCRAQSCQPGGAVTCPVQYQCTPSGTCLRTAVDAGTAFDAGQSMMSGTETPLPFLSNDPLATVGAYGPSEPRYVGGFPGRRGDVVAIDSARALVVLEQEGQLIGHASFRRGRDFIDDSTTASLLDTVGGRARITYNPDSRTVFACYIVGRGVRVRRSLDDGRTWGEVATTIEPPASDDGGFSSIISDCDIAPWRNGGALMVTVEDDKLVARSITAGTQGGMPVITVEDPGQVAMASSPPDAGNAFNPLRPSIATLPADGQVHIVFTATRVLSGGLSDPEVFGVYRDGATGAFNQPQMLTFTGVPPFMGNPLPQDHATVTIDPTTKRALAAYVTVLPGVEQVSTVQMALWNVTQRRWATGSGLNVFTVETDGQTRILFPDPLLVGRQLDAFSPVLASLPNGKIWLSFVAGPRTPGQGNDFRFYGVPFDFEEPTPAGTARGWFKRPARRLADIRVLDPRGGSARPTFTGFAADGQLSFWGVFTEGFGPQGDQEGGRAVSVSIP
ncbi:MAG: hypothetical protein INH41_02345 [Myxococcaceae bacterium]|nr:hypothetical protein [Myxococcaceae bacterium]